MCETLYRLTLVALTCAVTAPAGAQLLVRKDLSYSIAKTIAEGALENCKSRGFNVSVVVDRAGEPRLSVAQRGFERDGSAEVEDFLASTVFGQQPRIPFGGAEIGFEKATPETVPRCPLQRQTC